MYRRAQCKVTAWTDAPIPWPRVLPEKSRGRPGLLVNTELRRAVRTESAEALMHWFGISGHFAWKLRKWAGVGGQIGTPGSESLHREKSTRGAEQVKARTWTPAERAEKGRIARRLGLRPTGRWAGRGWTSDEEALLGTDHDAAIADRIGRSVNAVMIRRVGLNVPAFSGRSWTAEEIALLGTADDEVIAGRVGRTVGAVTRKRETLNIPPPSGLAGGGRAWTAEEEALLGTDYDRVIAVKIGRSWAAVALRRNAKQITAFRFQRTGDGVVSATRTP